MAWLDCTTYYIYLVILLLFIPLYLVVTRTNLTGIENNRSYNTSDIKVASLLIELEMEKILLK